MKSLCITLTLILFIAASSFSGTVHPRPLTSTGLYSAEMQAAINTLPSDLKTQLDSQNTKLLQYSATHTEPETLIYAETLIYEMSEDGFDDGSGVESKVYFPQLPLVVKSTITAVKRIEGAVSAIKRKPAGLNTMRHCLNQLPLVPEFSWVAAL